MASQSNRNKESKSAAKDVAALEHSSPAMLRSGMLMLLSAFKICEATDKDFKAEAREVLAELKDLISEPETIERLRKAIKL